MLLVVFMPVMAQETAREVHTYEEWEYVTNETGLTLTAYSGSSPELEIPSKIYDISVTALAENLFKNNSSLRSVVIPNSVASIGRYAFQGCSSLAEIKLPVSLTRIESYTFRYCTSLESIELPGTLTTISSYAFSGCINLKSILIPDSVKSIGTSAFDDCTSLEKITVSNNLNYLEGYVFRNTPWLENQKDEFVLIGSTILLKWNGADSIVDIPYGVTMVTDAFADSIYVESVNIPSTVTRIGPNAFRDAVNLKNVSIPDTVTRIDSNAFRGCRSLRSIVLPESIQSMGDAVFRNCEKLTQADLPSRMKSIPSYLLGECAALTDVVIPSTVTSIHESAFSGSDQVRLHVTYDSAGEQYAKDHLLAYTYYLQQTKDFVYSKNDDGIQILKYIGNLFEVEVPPEIDGLPVNRINTAAFQDNQFVRSVSLPDSVTSIGDWAFSYMGALESFDMSAGLIRLGADAFTGSGLQFISLPDTIEEIGVEPFEGIESLTLCVAADSYAGQTLSDMGYAIESGDSCTQAVLGDASVSVGNLEDVSIPTAAVVPTEANAPATEITATAVIINTVEPVYTATPLPTSAPTIEPTMTPIPEPLGILYIPEDTEKLTADMLENTTKELTLVIPSGVSLIDDSILDGHELTIVSDVDSEAEAFARKWDLKFLLKQWYELDYGTQENNQ